MQGDARVIEFLNRGLRHELAAINQYWLHYRLLHNWGYLSLAKKWRQESIEEMQHADKIVERIIFLDGFPNMQVIDPLHIGQNVKEVLDCDLAAEMSARALYQEAATHCHAVKDYVSRDLFEKLMHDEEEHIDYLETQLDLVAKLGLELYAQHHMGKTDDVLGRSHRSKIGRAKLKRAIDLTREVLEVPADYRIGIVPASDTGAVEMALWSMLGARPVTMLAWESFGEGWVSDVTKELKF